MAGKRYWFRRKTYGWGWVPTTWQGYTVLGIYTGALATLVITFEKQSHQTADALTSFFLDTLALTVILLAVTYWKGERPSWQWGTNKDEKSADS
jgi:hypothetical protein